MDPILARETSHLCEDRETTAMALLKLRGQMKEMEQKQEHITGLT